MTAIDITPLINTIIGLIFTGIIAAFASWQASHQKDKQADQSIDNALKNGLGAMQQAIQKGVSTHPMQIEMPWISAAMAAGVQYVVDQVSPEMARRNLSKEQVVKKLDARLGVQNIATNVATASSPAATPMPLSPIPNPSK